MQLKIIIPTLLISFCILNSFAQITHLKIKLYPHKTYQKIDHFGASDAWAFQFVGNWNIEKRNKIADLLFSQDTTTTGQPLGIGLSLWRFNIGAGSTEQGTQSGIGDHWRRAECFMDSAGNYDWHKQAGQMWFLTAAKQRNVPYFLGFTNSPPVFFTKNHKAFATNGIPNLDENQTRKFADFLTTVTKGIQQKTGILFNYLSPVNEPQWKWSEGGQEGSPFTNTDIFNITNSLSQSLIKANISTKISIVEAGQIDYMYQNKDKPSYGSQTDYFFKKTSSFNLNHLPNVERAISGHSYFTTSPNDTLIIKRNLLKAKINEVPNLNYWMSEYCILGDNAGEIDGNKQDLGMKSALYLAKVIHHDLTVANATSWSWWTALSRYDYKDGLIYLDSTQTNENYYTSKMLWAMGNFSRFIRPGYVMIESKINKNKLNSCLVSAYKHPTENKYVLVVINENATATGINISGLKPKNIMCYTTSEYENLNPKKIKNKTKKIIVSPYSINSFLLNF